MTDQETEDLIQQKGADVAPRLTPAQIEAVIRSEHYFKAADGVYQAEGQTPEELELITYCVLVLLNGFVVTGESACASPANFNAEIGRRIARENAVNKIWPLEGYLLKQMLHVAKMDATAALQDPSRTDEGREAICQAMQSGDPAVVREALAPRNSLA